jgi:hypothetical protein
MPICLAIVWVVLDRLRAMTQRTSHLRWWRPARR